MPTLTDALQLIVAVVVAYVAVKALQTTNAQAKSAQDALGEMRKDRHIAAVPILSIEPFRVIFPMAMATEITIKNETSNPAVEVVLSAGEARDRGAPADAFLHIVPTVAMVGAGASIAVPVEFKRFARYEGEEPNRLLRTNWVHFRLQFRGILGARVQEDWYWEPYEWLGARSEPHQGHGEKLGLWAVTGSSGSGDPNDISFLRA